MGYTIKYTISVYLDFPCVFTFVSHHTCHSPGHSSPGLWVEAGLVYYWGWGYGNENGTIVGAIDHVQDPHTWLSRLLVTCLSDHLPTSIGCIYCRKRCWIWCPILSLICQDWDDLIRVLWSKVSKEPLKNLNIDKSSPLYSSIPFIVGFCFFIQTLFRSITSKKKSN